MVMERMGMKGPLRLESFQRTVTVSMIWRVMYGSGRVTFSDVTGQAAADRAVRQGDRSVYLRMEGVRMKFQLGKRRHLPGEGVAFSRWKMVQPKKNRQPFRKLLIE